MTGVHLPPAPIPEPRPDDDDDVSWKLQTAAVEWRRGAHEDALTWLRRAADAAIELEMWSRGADLNAAAVRIEKLVAGAGHEAGPGAPPSSSHPALPTFDSPSLAGLSFPPVGRSDGRSPPRSIGGLPPLPPGRRSDHLSSSKPPGRASAPTSSPPSTFRPSAFPVTEGPSSARSSIVIDVEDDEVVLTDDELLELEREERSVSVRPDLPRPPAPPAPAATTPGVEPLPAFPLEASRPLWEGLDAPTVPLEPSDAPSSLPAFAMEVTAGPPPASARSEVQRDRLPSYLGGELASAPSPLDVSPPSTAELPAFTLDTEAGRLPEVAPGKPAYPSPVSGYGPAGHLPQRPSQGMASGSLITDRIPPEMLEPDDDSIPGIGDDIIRMATPGGGLALPEIEEDIPSQITAELELEDVLDLEPEPIFVEPAPLMMPVPPPRHPSSSPMPVGPDLRTDGAARGSNRPLLGPVRGVPSSAPPRSSQVAQVPRPIAEAALTSGLPAELPASYREPAGSISDAPTPPRGTPIPSFPYPSSTTPIPSVRSAERREGGELPAKARPLPQAPVSEAPALVRPPPQTPVSEAPASVRPPPQAPVSEAPALVRPPPQAPVSEAPASVRPSSEGSVSEAPAAVRPSEQFVRAAPAVGSAPAPRTDVREASGALNIVEPVPDEPPASLPPVVSRQSEPSGGAEGHSGERGVVEGVDLAAVRGLSELPDSARRILARRARVEELAAGEEVCFFSVALVVHGWVSLMPAIADAACASAVVGEVVFTEGTLPEGVALRAVAGESGTRVAVWDSHALVEATVDCPWLLEDLRLMADGFQALAGASLGPLGERLDDALRSLVTARCEVRALSAGDILVEGGRPVPGLHIIGGGEVELVDEGGKVLSTHGNGEFLFSAQVLAGGPAPCTARAAAGGALVLFSPRMVAHELLVSVPPLLELLGE